MALIPYRNVSAEKNIDNLDKLGVRPELTFMFIGPPRLSLIKNDDLINLATALNGMVNIIDNVVNIDYGFLKLVGLLNSFSVSVYQRNMPIKALGSKSIVLESSDNILGSIQINRLVVPDNIVNKLSVRQSQDDYSVDDLAKELITNITKPVVNPFNTIKYNIETIRRPFGILILELNKAYNTPVGANYFEMCKIINLSKSVQAGQGVLIESLSCQFTEVKEVLPQ